MALTRPLKGLSTRSITPSPSFPSVTVGRPRLCSGNCQREVGCCQAAELHGVSALLVRVSAHRLVFQQRAWCCTDGPAPPAFLAPTGSAASTGLCASHPPRPPSSARAWTGSAATPTRFRHHKWVPLRRELVRRSSPQCQRGLRAGQQCTLHHDQLLPARLDLLEHARLGRVPRALPEPVRPCLPGPREAGGDLP